MKKHSVFFILLILPIFLFFFQNCGRPGNFDPSLFEGIPVQDNAVAGLNEQLGLRVTSQPNYIRCYENQISIGGWCNTGGATFHLIRYGLSLGGQSVPWEGNVRHLETICENGRWSAIVPRPPHALLRTGTQFIEFTLQLELFVYDQNTQEYRLALRPPLTTVAIDPIPCPP